MKITEAVVNNFALIIRLKKDQLANGQGRDELILTKRLIEKLEKAQRLNKGADLKVSKDHVRRIAQRDGSLRSSIAAVGVRAIPKALPMALSAVSKVLPGLATGALSSLGSFGMDKILGQGVQTGGFMIPGGGVYCHIWAI